ncbi:MAG: S-methyl-5-thioribose-1-phosphate isomerase [Candidatus Aureabacteria bacterium]|nr:S-methyl-5-thioribose-1-phosphate isomerase [Candidatus Auribacterota bacterium]
MSIEAVSWSNGKVKLIDQTKLPGKLTYVVTDDITVLWDSIKRLVVRGAPAIGIAGAFGVALAALKSRAKNCQALKKDVFKAADYLATSRPTAVNLFWALGRMKQAALSVEAENCGSLRQLLLEEAIHILDDDKMRCSEIGRNGERLIKEGMGILTHCNAGALATGGSGTALSVFFSAKRRGKKFTVYVDETRPLLQGARLTTWELLREGIDTVLIADNMAAQVMKEGKIGLVITGSDRIALNGDAANKIGTYGIATLAKAHGIPFYVAAPVSTIDFNIKRGREIPIEQRDASEITSCRGKKIAPGNVKVYNPAFDVTPASLIAGIITEKGLITPPYKNKILMLKKKKGCYGGK